MDVDSHLRHLTEQASLLALAAERHGPDAPIPTCPDWVMRDLVHHQGGVHRWATHRIARPEIDPGPGDLEAFVGGWPSDDSLLDWFNEGAAGIAAAIHNAPVDLEAMTFIPSPSPRQFWARRQAMELAIHRADAESAGGAIAPFVADLAVDGIDELVVGFATRPMRRYRTDTTATILVAPTDSPHSWLIRMSPEGISTTADSTTPSGADSTTRSAADATISGTASDLFLFVWNRLTAADIHAAGDPAALALWSKTSRVGW